MTARISAATRRIGRGDVSERSIKIPLSFTAEIVSGRRPGRRAAEEITVFKSVGFALEDLATARLAYNRAIAENAGTEIEL